MQCLMMMIIKIIIIIIIIIIIRINNDFVIHRQVKTNEREIISFVFTCLNNNNNK